MSNLRTFPAADLARDTATILDAAIRSPVAITKHRKPKFVIMSLDRYEQLIDHGRTRHSVAVADMPDDLGALLDRGIEDHLRGR
jgi:prevent-host-death family protein